MRHDSSQVVAALAEKFKERIEQYTTLKIDAVELRLAQMLVNEGRPELAMAAMTKTLHRLCARVDAIDPARGAD